MHTKGLSDVVTTVLIILLVLVATATIWNFIRPVLTQAGERIQTGTTTIHLQIPPQSVKYDSLGNSNYITLNVQRSAGVGNMSGLDVVIEDSSGKSIVIRQNISVNELETKSITLNGTGLSRITKVSVAPIFKSNSGKELLGEVQNSFTLNSPNPGNNLIDSSTWRIGVAGSQAGFSQNGDITENIIELGTGPAGNNVPLWKGGNDAVSDADGGWNSDSIPIDYKKTYRYSVWIKKIGSDDGTTYFGAGGDWIMGSNLGVNYFDGTNEQNPYFFCGDLPSLDKWYLLVGYVHPYNYPGPSIGGIYDGATKQKVVSFASGNCNTDFNFKTTSVSQMHRAYLYYDTTLTDRQYFYGPRIDIVDGTEPTIPQMLG